MTIRCCIDCGFEFPSGRPGGQSIRCLPCRATYKKLRQRRNNRDFYARNRDAQRMRSQKWRDENPEKVAAIAAFQKERKKTPEYRARRRATRDSERENAQQRARYAANPCPSLAASRAWKELHREELSAKQVAFMRDHPEINRAKANLRRSKKLQATPAWADHGKIIDIYANAVRLTRETGVPYHVDHFYPLKSNIVCGLHVETNLRITTAEENHRKKNKMPDDYFNILRALDESGSGLIGVEQ